LTISHPPIILILVGGREVTGLVYYSSGPVTPLYSKTSRNGEHAMAFVPVSHVAKLDLVYLQGEQEMVNTLYVYSSIGWSTSTLTDLAGFTWSWWDDEYGPFVSSDVSLKLIRARDLTEQDGPVIEYISIDPAVGDGVSPVLPGNVTCTVKFLTGLAGKRNRGRVYVVGLQEASVTGNRLITGHSDDWIAAFMAFKSMCEAHSWTHMQVHQYTKDGPLEAGVARPIVQYACDGVVRSQRRRLPRA
jgi:hypothetical protein